MAAISSNSLDEIVLPQYKEKWHTMKKKWFVINESCPYEAREPGLLKTEVESCPNIQFIGKL
jgi:hypothetical protein